MPISSTILVVEDDALLRFAAIAIIEDAGLKAVAASQTAEALKLLERHSDIGVVFTDVDMGSGKDGIWLALQVRNRWPSTQIIVTSGHRDVRPDMLPSGAIFLPKPYAEDVVLEEMRRMAGRTSQPLLAIAGGADA